MNKLFFFFKLRLIELYTNTHKYLYTIIHPDVVVKKHLLYIQDNAWYFFVDNTWSYKSKPLYLNFEKECKPNYLYFEKDEYKKNNTFKAFLYIYEGVSTFSREHCGLGSYKIHIYIDAIVITDKKYSCKSFYMGKFKCTPYDINQNYRELIKLMKILKYPCGTIIKIRLKAIPL